MVDGYLSFYTHLDLYGHYALCSSILWYCVGFTMSPKHGYSRSHYPSGPMIGGIVSRSKYEPTEKPMNEFSISKVKIIRHLESNGFLVLEVVYEECKNYEGRKILVYKGPTLVDMFNQKEIEPHFLESKDSKLYHPIARFVPTEEGWEYAKRFVAAQPKKPIFRSIEDPRRPFRPKDEDHQ